jgi:hypothetical protein
MIRVEAVNLLSGRMFRVFNEVWQKSYAQHELKLEPIERRYTQNAGHESSEPITPNDLWF